MKKGLTLTEILVVGATLLVLTLILVQVPRLEELWRQHRATRCLSHLRQLGAAVRMYVDDYDGKFPFAGRDAPYADKTDVWRGLSKYVEGPELFLCPEDPLPAYNIRWVRLHGAGKMSQRQIAFPSSYAYLQAFYRPFDCSGGQNVPGPPRSMSLSEVTYPAQKALFNCYASEWARPAAARAHHPEGWALGFVDGHARLTSWNQLNRARRGVNGDERYNLDWTLCGIAGRDLR
jgi:hypothetical protein